MKFLKWLIIIVLIVVVAGYGGLKLLTHQTKKASPEDRIEFKNDNIQLSVFYCRPYKKDRVIFGELVPFNEVWRTGANEATTFTCSTNIKFGEKLLKAGTYTLWTIPQETQWTVILSSKQYDWGVGWGGVASREPEFDVLKVNVPTIDLDKTIEQFTIAFEYNVNLTMSWDKTKVSIPIRY